MTYKTGYDFNIGDSVYFYIPAQYSKTTMYPNGVETDVISHISGRWIQGVYEGQPAATSGHWVRSVKPIDGGLWLVESDAPMKTPATVSDIITHK